MNWYPIIGLIVLIWIGATLTTINENVRLLIQSLGQFREEFETARDDSLRRDSDQTVYFGSSEE